MEIEKLKSILDMMPKIFYDENLLTELSKYEEERIHLNSWRGR